MAEPDKNLVLSYETCKNLTLPYFLKKQSENQTALDRIKEKYKDVVDSPRRYEAIKDPQSLFIILEKRGVLSVLDINILEDIFRDLNINRNILEQHKKLIETYKGEDVENRTPPNTSFRGRPTSSRYNTPGRTQNERPYNVNFNNVNSNRHRLSERVVTEISTRIGQSWRSLACFLKVQECTINEIDEDSTLARYEDKTRAVLQVYESRIDPADLKTTLLNALDLVERRDLRHTLEKIFLRER